jgi:hypothetical protein
LFSWRTVKGQLKEGTYVAPQKIPTFGALVDSCIAGRIEQSRKPGAGYRPSSLAQWQTYIAHMKSSFDAVRANQIDAQAIEKAIGQWRQSKDQGGRGLSVKTVREVLTTMSRIFRFGIRNQASTGMKIDPTKLIEKVKDESGEQTESGERLVPAFTK